MHWILDYELLFFDFDGLLVNTEHLHFSAYKQLLKAHGVDFPWDFLTFAGIAHQSSEGLRQAITNHCQALVEEVTWEELYREKMAYYVELLESGKLELMPRVLEILQLVQAQGVPHAVVTNSTHEQVTIVQRYLSPLRSIPMWITREDYTSPKPAPDSYLKAIATLGGGKEKMLGFEDSLRGVYSLQQANITPVLVCSPNHPQLENVKSGSLLYFPSFKELLVSV